MTAFVAFARMGFLRMLAYRVRYLVGVANYFLYVAVAYFLWEAVFQARAAEGAERIGNWDLDATISYIAIGWIIRAAYFNNVDSALMIRFVKGDISIDMTRPCSLYVMFYGDAAGEGIFRFCVMSIPAASLIVLVFPVQGPASPAYGLIALASALLAFHLFFCLNFLTGLLALYVENLQGFLWAKFNIMQLLSGLLFPIDFYPPAIVAVLKWLPFIHISYTPLAIYLGKVEGEDLLLLLGIQAAWAAALYGLCELAWRHARAKLSIQGG